MIWNILVAFYIVVALFSMYMTLREGFRDGHARIWGTLMGIVGCAIWPATVAVLSVGVSLDRNLR